MNTEEFIERAKSIYGDKYTYENTIYKNYKTKVIITCPIHGDFLKSPGHFLNGQGCPECSGRVRHTTKSFVEKCKKVHGDTYDLSQIEFVNYHKKIKVICKEHGEFTITPGHFLEGQGCPKCRYLKSADSNRKKQDEIIELANRIHNHKYDYSEVKYQNSKTKICIICHEKDENGNEHGVFFQTPENHIKNKQGCPKCGILKNSNTQRYSYETVINKSKEIHNYKYDYINTNDYINTMSYLTIICPEHGIFKQMARNHLFGQGCPKCFFTKSKLEENIANYIKSIINKTIVIENDRKILKGKELDILIPDKNIAFEIDGLIWHSDKFENDKDFHLNKTEECEKQNIKLIHIFEDEWIEKQEIVKSKIKNILGYTDTKIYARKCEIKEVTYNDSVNFLNKNHLQGNCVSKIRYGLYYNDELVSLMTFGSLRKNLNNKKHKNKYELLRFCNKINTTVIGGASKLLKHFINVNKPLSIISYADRRWSNGNLYEKLGFKFIKNTTPSYFYVINKKRENRFKYRKDVLVRKYNCPKDMTEKEFCTSQGWFRIYDCGTKKYELNLQ